MRNLKKQHNLSAFFVQSIDIDPKFLKFDMEMRCTEVGLTFGELFEGIVIGPKSAQDIGSLQSFVEEMGFTSLRGKISKSDCPLR